MAKLLQYNIPMTLRMSRSLPLIIPIGHMMGSKIIQMDTQHRIPHIKMEKSLRIRFVLRLFQRLTAAIAHSLVFLYRAQTLLQKFDRMSVTYISSLSFDAKKKIVSALYRVIPRQEFCVPDCFKFPSRHKDLSLLNGVIHVCAPKLECT